MVASAEGRPAQIVPAMLPLRVTQRLGGGRI
jgi:hypothetical protein